ncbi:MAG: hypothetical protein WCA77_00100, partial [Thermoplasmata archaeon]
LKSRLTADLNGIPGPDGKPLGVRVLDPREIYATVRGDPPDLMVYFDELRWRSAGTLGHPSNYLRANDTGPDDAVHGEEGVLVLFDPRVSDGRTLPSQSILDVMPTLLSILGEPIPGYVQGRPIAGARPRQRSAEVPSSAGLRVA